MAVTEFPGTNAVWIRVTRPVRGPCVKLQRPEPPIRDPLPGMPPPIQPSIDEPPPVDIPPDEEPPILPPDDDPGPVREPPKRKH